MAVDGGNWVNVHAAAAVAALACCSVDAPRRYSGGFRVGVMEAADAVWLGGDALGSFMTAQLLDTQRPDGFYAIDVVLGRVQPADRSSEPGRATPPVWIPGAGLPPVDTAVISPMGFRPYPDRQVRALEPRDLGQGS